MNQNNKIREMAHVVLDRVLDVSQRVGGERGLMTMLKVLTGVHKGNQDNARYDQYQAAMDTLHDIGESALNGQGT